MQSLKGLVSGTCLVVACLVAPAYAQNSHTDFNGDGKADILWRSGSGENYIFFMDGTSLLGTSNYTNTVPDLNWLIVGSRDYDGDGKADILWRNKTSGENYVFLMDGTVIKAGSNYINSVPDLGWHIVGSGDFDGDGKADILWRNKVTGEDYLFLMNGTTVRAGSGYTNLVPDLNWQIAGVGDFDGDGKADILWRNKTTGENYIFLVNGTTVLGASGYINSVPDPNWEIGAIGDYNGDGKADVLWRNVVTGDDYIFFMNGTVVLGISNYTNTVSDLNWLITGSADYNGDGKADILWRNKTTGENYIFFMDGTTLLGTSNYTNTVPLTWAVAGGPTLPTGTPAADEVRINETVPFQALDGVGAAAFAFPFASDLGWDWNSVSFVFDELDLHYIRLVSWFNLWEPVNDNADPTVVDWSALLSNDAITPWHDVPFAQFLAGRGIDVELGVWDVSDWLAGGSPRHIAPAMYPELGESIATYLRNMINHGVPQHVTEVQNEPAIEAQIQYPSPQALRDAALAVLARLDGIGLTDVQLHGPNFHTPTGAAEWAAVWLASPSLAQRTAAVSYHTWWSDNFADYDAIRQVAEAAGKPVWATEVGYCALPSGCFGGTHFLLPETWGTAWDYALSYYRAIAWSHATRVYHWSLVGYDAVVSPTGVRYPSFYVLKQFANFIPPGARLLESESGDANVLVLAFARPDGNTSVILLNTAGTARTIRLNPVRASPPTLVSGRVTVDGSFDQPITAPYSSAGLSVTLPSESVTSLVVATP